MKISTIIATTALGCALSVATAFAQTAQQDMQQYISSHPELQANPSLINNPTYRANHPALNHFIETHPQVDRQRYGAAGAYDRNHVWRNSDWWHHNNDPRWNDRYRSDWYHSHPGWGPQPVAPRAYEHHDNVAEYGHRPHRHVW